MSKNSISSPIMLNRSEWAVMNTVWSGFKMVTDFTVGELLEKIAAKKTWNVSTLKTVLERLVKKGVLQSVIRGRTCFYKPLVVQDEVVKENLSSFLDTVLDGTFGPLVAYLAEKKKLKPGEIKELEKLLKDNR